MKTNIDMLEIKINESEKKLTKYRNELRKLKEKKELPLFKKKYEGKTYKYRNCYSCPESPSDYWWLYLKVIKVVDLSYCIAIKLQMDKYGFVSIEERGCLPLPIDGSYRECSISEFKKGTKKIIDKIKRLYK